MDRRRRRCAAAELLLLWTILVVVLQPCSSSRKTLNSRPPGSTRGAAPRVVQVSSVVTHAAGSRGRGVGGRGPTTTTTGTSDNKGNSSFAPCPCDVQGGCRCVQFYLCLEGTITSNGFGVIRKRAANSCSAQTEVCCPEPSTAHDAPISVPQVVDQPGTCGSRRLPAGKKGWTAPSWTYFGEFPWTVLILSKKDSVEPLCSGALVHEQVVVTSAHCVDEYHVNHLKVVAGDWDYGSGAEPLPREERAVTLKLFHEDYDGDTLAHAVALLVLGTPVPASANVHVVCLPARSPQVLLNRQCFSTGWGNDEYSSDERRIMTMKKILWKSVHSSETDCLEVVKDTSLEVDYASEYGQMCATAKPQGEVCQNDVGSPLVCPDQDNPHRYVLMGLAYGRIECGSKEFKELFVDVPRHSSWIKEKILYLLSQGL